MNVDDFSLQTLIKFVPIDEETRKELLELEPKLSPEEKYRLSKLCWLILRFVKREEYRDKVMNSLDEIAKGKKKYSRSEFASFEKDVVDSLMKKIPGIEADKQLSEVRKQLKQENKPTQDTDKS